MIGNTYGAGYHNIPWNKGLKGYTNKGSFKKGHETWIKGKKHTEQAKAKMSKSKKELVINGWKPWNVGFGDYIAGEKSPNWKGGKDDYRGPNWLSQRRKALERDAHTCQRCGSQDDLCVHHIVAFRKYELQRHLEANRMENLITLCRTCHSEVEAENDRARMDCVQTLF